MVNEYCALGTIYHVLKNQEINWERAIKMAIEIAKGVNCLHCWKPAVVHRDLKTLNLFVDTDWRVKVSTIIIQKYSI